MALTFRPYEEGSRRSGRHRRESAGRVRHEVTAVRLARPGQSAGQLL
jgi:hypothetical protein